MIGVSLRAQRWLDFDIENRPLSYLGQDFTTADITAIAWQFIGEPEQTCVLLGRETQEQMLRAFLAAYNTADAVTGHYIKKHDLPIINGSLMELGLPTLGPKMVQDTKLDLIKRAGISASQENLAGMYGLAAPKVQMSTTKWREANRLTPEGIAFTEERVRADVTQHIQLRATLLARGHLKPARIWRP